MLCAHHRLALAWRRASAKRRRLLLGYCMRPILFALIVIPLIPVSAFAQTDLTYWQDIRPIFRKHCTACHSTKNLREVDVSGGLALDTFAAAKKGSKRVVIT